MERILGPAVIVGAPDAAKKAANMIIELSKRPDDDNSNESRRSPKSARIYNL